MKMKHVGTVLLCFVFSIVCEVIFNDGFEILSAQTSANSESPVGNAPGDSIENAGNMVKIPAGVFYMGSNSTEGFTNEKPYHPVYLDEYWIDMFEVTNEEYCAFLNGGDNDEHYNPLMRDEKTCGIYKNNIGLFEPVPGRDRYPVTYVSWEAANAYAKWAGKRLPTEAEWEKAARGGILGRQYSTRGFLSKRYANYAGRGLWDEWDYTSPVGMFEPNEYYVYDMCGNVWEWVQDFYAPNFYKADTMYNPVNDPDGLHPYTDRIIRGGSWADTYEKDNYLRVSCRGPNYPIPENWTNRIGFRCASSTRPVERERLSGIDYLIEELKKSSPQKYTSLSKDSLRSIILQRREAMLDANYKSNIKSMKKAIALSSIVPGTGQIYSGRWLSGLIFLGIEAAAWYGGLTNLSNERTIDYEFRNFADEHFDAERYLDWLYEYRTIQNNHNPPDYIEIDIEKKYRRERIGIPGAGGIDYIYRDVVIGWQLGKSFYYQIASFRQFNPGWDDYNQDSDEDIYGYSGNQQYYKEIREYRKKQKADYNKRAKFYGSSRNFVAPIICT